jgi:hypothetical protein
MCVVTSEITLAALVPVTSASEERSGPLPGPTLSSRRVGRRGSFRHSHSMVPGGLLVTSSTTRLTSATSLVIRVEILASTS